MTLVLLIAADRRNVVAVDYENPSNGLHPCKNRHDSGGFVFLVMANTWEIGRWAAKCHNTFLRLSVGERRSEALV